jgi:hypothetical protein
MADMCRTSHHAADHVEAAELAAAELHSAASKHE